MAGAAPEEWPNGKVEGRPEAPSKRRACILHSGACGAQPPAVHGSLQRLLEVAPFLGAVMSYPQFWQAFGTHRWNWDANGASHDGHLILPNAKAQDTRSQGTASTTSKKASAVQTITRTENSHGNIHRSRITAKAAASNDVNELASSR
jgi:hypothetical protein